LGSGGIAPRISALDLGEWSDSRTGRFTSGVRDPLPIGWEVGWAPESVWTERRREKFLLLPLPGNEPRSSSPL